MTIGFIGLGIMGESMCENIIKKHDESVYLSDLNAFQVQKLSEKGGIACGSNRELAEKADVIISMVPRSEHLQSICNEILPVLDETKIWIDMSTVDPSASVAVYQTVRARGCRFADAPVVKSKPAAISGTLGIYVGCEESLFPEILPILSYMGSNVIRMGENGKGLVMKICHNTLVAQIQNGVNETLVLAGHYGIDPETFATAVSYGGGQNFYLDGQWEKLRDENWTTAFSLENMHKDLWICMRLSEEAGVFMPGMQNAKAVYDKGIAAGIGKEDFRATFKVVKGECDA